jgi:hypothetical protein
MSEGIAHEDGSARAIRPARPADPERLVRSSEPVQRIKRLHPSLVPSWTSTSTVAEHPASAEEAATASTAVADGSKTAVAVLATKSI